MSLIDLIVDGVSELVGAGIGPESDRGLVATSSSISVVLLLATVGVLVTAGSPFALPWGVAAFGGAILSGLVGILLSTLHLWRTESDRLFGYVCLLSNAAAAAIPVSWILTR